MCENKIIIQGRVLTEPVLSHTSHGMGFYTFLLESVRLSGTADRLPVHVPSSLPRPERGQLAAIGGQVRSYNNRSGTGARLVIYIWAQSVLLLEPRAEGNAPENNVTLAGTLCKEPSFRRTPFGREICDLTLAVPRGRTPGKTDYLPCITWGQAARQASKLLRGDLLRLEGRLQSRQYRKLYEDGREEEKTAYEVSAARIL